MEKTIIEHIKILAEQELSNLTENEQGAKYYLMQIIEAAETLLNDGY